MRGASSNARRNLQQKRGQTQSGHSFAKNSKLSAGDDPAEQRHTQSLRCPIKRDHCLIWKERALPQALKALTAQTAWVFYKNESGKKVPYQPRHPNRRAKSNDPKTWASYDEACAAAAEYGDGIGFNLLGSGIGALDLDDCRDPKTGVIAPWARRIIAKAGGTYVEVSPSGTGVHVLGLTTGRHIDAQRKMGRGKVEIYRNAPRYITVTGNQLGNCSKLRNIDRLIDELARGAPRKGEPIELDIDTDRHDWREVVERLRCPVRRYVSSEVEVGKRSHVIWLIGQTLREHGATPSEIACVLMASKAWQSKNGDDLRRLKGEVGRIFNR